MSDEKQIAIQLHYLVDAMYYIGHCIIWGMVMVSLALPTSLKLKKED